MIAVLLILAAVSIVARRRDPGTAEPPRRPVLHATRMTGCYALELGPWSPGGAAIEALPDHFLLLADSLDQWGRAHDTYRAVPLDAATGGAGDPGPDRRAGPSPPDTPDGEIPYRWFVRADTLWLVWTRGEALGGVALRGGVEGLVGRARISAQADSLDVTARARASRVNCATRRPERARSRRR